MDNDLIKAMNTLREIEKEYDKSGKWIIITVTDDTVEYWGGKTQTAIPKDRCYETIGDNDLIDAVTFELQDGRKKTLAGQWIEKWEVVED